MIPTMDTELFETRPELVWGPEPEIEEAPEVRGRRGARLLSVALAAVLGSVTGAGAMVAFVDRPPVGEVQVAAPAEEAGLTGVAAVAAAVSPSVVRVDVTSGGGRFGVSTGTGSGVIYRSDGYVITNAHVVDGASSVEVVLSTGDRLPATVVGNALPSDDIAVLRVDRVGLPAATLGSVEDVNVGDPAIAIGSPFGLEGSVTAGVVSALHRNIDLGGGERFTDAVQTDAPINPGNSGGALADSRGAVIGINTAIVGSSAGNVGVGFAIPIDIARLDADQIIETGHASRPMLGIAGEDAGVGAGAMVQDVTPGSPAERAGLRPGDVIVALDGRAISSMDELVSVLSRMEVGATVNLSYERDGTRTTVDVQLAARTG
jgi:S1-C subfamily serine protease